MMNTRFARKYPGSIVEEYQARAPFFGGEDWADIIVEGLGVVLI